jgi:hypothetical protein
MLAMKTPRPRSMALHIRKEITHHNEMNDKMFNVDFDMNMWDIARNIIEPILFHLFHRFHLFHGHSNATMSNE